MNVASDTYKSSDAPVLCSRPACPLKKPGIVTEYLATVFPPAVMDGSLDHWAKDSERVKMRTQCVHCALGVLEGRKTYPTAGEWKRLVALGHWHERRQHRRTRRRH